MKITPVIQSEYCPRAHVNYFAAKEILESEGYEFTNDSVNKLIILCLLYDSVEKSIVSGLISLKERTGGHIVIAGCMDQYLARELIQHNTRAGNVFDKWLTEQQTYRKFANIPHVFFGSVFAIELNTGCRGACTFCRLRHRNTTVESTSSAEVIEIIGENYCEGKVYSLFSNDCGANNESVVDMCYRIRDVFPGIKINIHYVNNNFVAENYEKIGELFHDGTLVGIGTSVQSASERVLATMGRKVDMNRLYSAVTHIRKKMPRNTLFYSEFIYGFPTEHETDFSLSMEFAKVFTHALWYRYEALRHTESALLYPHVTRGVDRSGALHEYARKHGIASYKSKDRIAWVMR